MFYESEPLPFWARNNFSSATLTAACIFFVQERQPKKAFIKFIYKFSSVYVGQLFAGAKWQQKLDWINFLFTKTSTVVQLKNTEAVAVVYKNNEMATSVFFLIRGNTKSDNILAYNAFFFEKRKCFSV